MEEWDVYWKKQRAVSSVLYDAVAAFYRRFIIRPYLNRYLKKYFRDNAKVLHAGCGSGQVDVDVRRRLNITAMDISGHALALYKASNPDAGRVLQADIFKTPFADAAFDGVYNLGVMEHFTGEEIRDILAEFSRVIRPGGRLVLFWPPEFGLSVRFLDAVHFVANRIFKKSLQLHPAEITRVKSRVQVEGLCTTAGLRMIGYHFGIPDLFTQAVVALEKGPDLSPGPIVHVSY